MAKRRFTVKQWDFINYFMIHKNGTKAADLAGYQGTENTLAAIASENLRKPHIRKEIQRRMNASAMEAEEVLARLSDQAQIDMGDFLDVRHNYAAVDLEKAKDLGLLRHVKKFKVTPRGTEIELYSSQSALQTLAKVHGLLNDKIEVNINIDLVITAWKELEEAGLSPAAAFQELINLARAERQGREVESDSA